MQSNVRCPFSSEELALYRRFKTYDFDNDAEFQRNYTHSSNSPSADSANSATTEQVSRLKDKLAYFTR
jgi:hypothetical protein